MPFRKVQPSDISQILPMIDHRISPQRCLGQRRVSPTVYYWKFDSGDLPGIYELCLQAKKLGHVLVLVRGLSKSF